MRNQIRQTILALFLATFAMALLGTSIAMSASKADIDRNARRVLARLLKEKAMAQALSEKAKGILVFPSIYKGGLIVGGQYGEGALIRDGKTAGYYSSVAASYGLQAGGQKFGYALFFMNDKAMEYLEKSNGWEIGVGPSLVVVDNKTAVAFGKSTTTSTLTHDIYAFIFNQKGLMAGLGLQGSKISRIHPK
jgi:lipid-binding SYLF domain-containing protein